MFFKYLKLLLWKSNQKLKFWLIFISNQTKKCPLLIKIIRKIDFNL